MGIRWASNVPDAVFAANKQEQEIESSNSNYFLLSLPQMIVKAFRYLLLLLPTIYPLSLFAGEQEWSIRCSTDWFSPILPTILAGHGFNIICSHQTKGDLQSVSTLDHFLPTTQGKQELWIMVVAWCCCYPATCGPMAQLIIWNLKGKWALGPRVDPVHDRTHVGSSQNRGLGSAHDVLIPTRIDVAPIVQPALPGIKFIRDTKEQKLLPDWWRW